MTEGMRSLLLSPAKRQRAVEQARAALGRDRMTTGVNVRMQGVGSASEHAATDAVCSG